MEGGKIYWTDYVLEKILRANLDGSNIEDIVTQGLSNPKSITVGITSRSAPTTAKEDVNRDGVVDVQDLVIVAQRYGHTGMDVADINEDKVVNVDDFILVAVAVDSAAAAAPAARATDMSSGGCPLDIKRQVCISLGAVPPIGMVKTQSVSLLQAVSISTRSPQAIFSATRKMLIMK